MSNVVHHFAKRFYVVGLHDMKFFCLGYHNIVGSVWKQIGDENLNYEKNSV